MIGNKKFNMLNKIYNLFLYLFLFLLPWQTRYIWHYGELNKSYWEYGTFSIYGTEILLWVILLMFFVQHFWNREFWTKLKEKKSHTSLTLLFLLFSLALSVVLSKNFWVFYYFIFKLLEALAFMTVLMLDNEKEKYQFALWAGAVAQGALAVVQFLIQHVWANKWLGMAGQDAFNLGPSVIEFADQRWLRAYGSFGSPNSLGIYLAVLFVLGLILYLRIGSLRIKILISVGQLFILSGLLVSFSRGAWLAAVAGIFCLLVILIYKRYKRKLSFPPQAGMTTLKEFGKQAIFALAVIIFWLAIFYPVFTARFNLNNRLEAKSISERQWQYSEVMTFVKSNPIFGVGPGAYTYTLYKKYPTLATWQYQPIHNIYLLALVELGFAGVILLFFLFKRLFVMIIKNNLIYFPVILTLLFAGLFDHWLWSMYAGMIFFWLIVGLGFIDKTKQME